MMDKIYDFWDMGFFCVNNIDNWFIVIEKLNVFVWEKFGL